MDIRDIIESPDVVGEKKLEKIYELQKVILDHYISIEGLPQYPIDVNTKASQVLLKDFTGRVTEELAEGYESHLLVQMLTEANKFWSDEDFDNPSKEYEQMINHLQNLNEEQADAMHFMVELLIFANIQPDDIDGWIELESKRLHMLIDESEDILERAMQFGRLLVEDDYTKGADCNLTMFCTEKQKAYLPGGNRFYSPFIKESKSTLWDVTQALNISRNCLKNKPWKQSGVMTDENLYQSKLVEAFIYMVGYFSMLGMSSWDVYWLYFKKNKVNQFRISSNY